MSRIKSQNPKMTCKVTITLLVLYLKQANNKFYQRDYLESPKVNLLIKPAILQESKLS